jgi:hypothetical protein
MLHDPKYLPFGSGLDKWEDSTNAVEAKIQKPRKPTINTYQNKAAVPKAETQNTENQNTGASQRSAKRFRVMVGAADRIENLLPK